MKIRFLHFTRSGKTPLPVESDRLYMYTVISRAITKNSMQSGIFKIMTYKVDYKQTFKKPRVGKKRMLEKWETEGTNRKQNNNNNKKKKADLSPNMS